MGYITYMTYELINSVQKVILLSEIFDVVIILICTVFNVSLIKVSFNWCL